MALTYNIHNYNIHGSLTVIRFATLMKSSGTDTKIYAKFILNTPNTVNDIKSKVPYFKMQLKQRMLKAQLMES